MLKKNIPLHRATEILKPRVSKIAKFGIAVETEIDVAKLREISREEDPNADPFNDPSYGWVI